MAGKFLAEVLFIVGLLLVAVMLLTGCSALSPMQVTCKGKGTLTLMGGPYAGTVQGDCGDGFEYLRTKPE